MNNFPAMTEERRQELVKHCKNNILQANGILPTLEGIDPNSEVARKVRKELELQEIALAALTADTSKLAELAAKVRKVREDAADFDGDRRGMWEHQEEQEQLLLEEAVKYTAPPAPVLRVPDGWQLVPLEPTEEMNKAGWRAMNEHDAINPTYRAMLAAAPEASNEQ